MHSLEEWLVKSNSVLEDNTGICVFFPWPIDSGFLRQTYPVCSLSLPPMPSLITLLFHLQPRLRRRLKKCGLLLTIIFLGPFHFTTMHMGLFAFQLWTCLVFISYVPRVNPSLLESAGWLCMCSLLGFLPSLKKPGELEHFIVRNMILKRMMAASPLRIKSVVADCVSALFCLWRDELISKWTPGCHTENNAATHKMEYIMFLKCQGSFQVLSQRFSI